MAYTKPILRLSAQIFVLSLLSHWKIGKKCAHCSYKYCRLWVLTSYQIILILNVFTNMAPNASINS